jgi:hypothetical protein
MPMPCSSPAHPTTSSSPTATTEPKSPTPADWPWTDHTTPPQVNHAHHPEELLRGNTDPPDDEDEK